MEHVIPLNPNSGEVSAKRIPVIRAKRRRKKKKKEKGKGKKGGKTEVRRKRSELDREKIIHYMRKKKRGEEKTKRKRNLPTGGGVVYWAQSLSYLLGKICTSSNRAEGEKGKRGEKGKEIGGGIASLSGQILRIFFQTRTDDSAPIGEKKEKERRGTKGRPQRKSHRNTIKREKIKTRSWEKSAAAFGRGKKGKRKKKGE